MPLDFNDPQVRLQVFGEQVELFLKSDVGLYLLQCADADKQDVLDSLRTVDPFNCQEVMKLQVKLSVANSIKGWLEQAITAGLQAYQTEE